MMKDMEQIAQEMVWELVWGPMLRKEARKRSPIAEWSGVIRVPKSVADGSTGLFWEMLARMREEGRPLRYERPSTFGPAWLWVGVLPKSLRPLCGAKTRAGGNCKARAADGRDRCRMHGGLSTGPKTEAGREAIRESNRRRAALRSKSV